MMKLAVFTQRPSLLKEAGVVSFLAGLGAFDTYDVRDAADLTSDTDMLLSLGGDGTFLSAARIVASTGIPVLGVNFGRMGFLSEYKPEDVAEALSKGEYSIEKREMLEVSTDSGDSYVALNEVSVSRSGAAMLGVDVTIDGQPLPTYWADGLLVSTSSGSTAYSLSVGGPICMPDSKVLVIAPIAPHNLNVRPLIVPSSTKVCVSLRSRENRAVLALDNRHFTAGPGLKLEISLAQFSLNRVRLSKTNFIGALRSKLFWGEDVRNETEQSNGGN